MKLVRLWIRPDGLPKAVSIGGVPKAWASGDRSGSLVDVRARSAGEARNVLRDYVRATELGDAVDDLDDPAEIGKLRQALRRVAKVEDNNVD